MQSKNAIGNLINRYKAVLKKCNLLNTFGSLAVVGMLTASLSANMLMPMQAQAISPTLSNSAYTMTDITGTTPEAGKYLTTFSTVENGVNKTYGVAFDASNTSVAHPYTSIKSVPGTPAVGGYTFRILDSSTATPDDYLYFAVENNGTPITTAGSRIQSDVYNPPPDNISGNFIGISATAFGGAIKHDASGTDPHNPEEDASIDSIIGDFIGNSAESYDGGAIYTTGGTIGMVIGNFIGNSAIDKDGGPIDGSGGAINSSKHHSEDGSIGRIEGDFIGNFASVNGGAIHNEQSITTIIGDFINNFSGGEGGAIYTDGSIGTIMSNFIGNSAANNGGAIWTFENLKFVADGRVNIFTGNRAGSSSNAIYVQGAQDLTFQMKGSGGLGSVVGGFIMDDAISGNSTYTVAISGDSTANTFNLNNSIGGTVTLQSATLHFGSVTQNATTYNGNVYNLSTSGTSIISGNAVINGTANISGTTSFNGATNFNGTTNFNETTNFNGTTTFANIATFTNGSTANFNQAITFNDVNKTPTFQTGSTANFNENVTFNEAVTLDDASFASGKTANFNSTSNFTGTTTFKGTTTLGAVNNSGDIIADGASFTNEYTVDGGLTTKNAVIFEAGYDATGTLTIDSGTTTFKGTITLGTVNNKGSIIADGANFTEKYTAGGSITTLNAVTFTEGYESAGTLNVGNTNTAGDVTLAANQNMTIKSGGDLNVVSGTLDVSGGILTVDSGASTFATGANGTLTAKASDFGTFGADGSFSRDGTDNVQKSLENAGHLILTDTGYGVIAKDTYKNLLANATLFGSGRGTINFKDVTLSSHYSLNDVENQYGLDQELMAGTLGGAGDNKNVSTSGIIANTIGLPGAKVTDSSIESGSTLSLRGNNTGNILLDEGSLTNEGTLNLGTAGATYSANFNGTLTTNGETTVFSHVIFDGAVTSGGTTVIENGAAFNAGLVVAGGITTLKDSITGTSTVSNGTLLVDAAGKTVTTGDIVLSTDGELEVVSGTLNMTADLTFNGGTLRSTSKSAGGRIADATAIFLPDLPSNFDGNIIVEQNAYTVLGGGDRAYAEEAFGESKHSWGTGVTAALFIAAPQSLASTGSIKVDGSNTQLSAADSNNAVFAANSLLVVDASGIGTSAAITATDGVLTVESSAKLHITGAANDSILTIVDGFSDGTSSVAAGSWEGDNLTTSTSLQVADVIGFDSGTGSYKVEVSAASSDDLRTIYQEMTEETAKLLTGVDPNDVDSYFAALLSDKLGKNSPKETTLRSEALLRIAQMAGVQSSGLNVGKSFFANVLRRMASFGLGGFAPQSQQLKREQGIPSGSSVENAGLSAGQNGQNTQGMKNGVALWVSPLYQYSNVHGVDVGAFKNGYETGLGGLTLGADYTFNDIFRVGLAFNVGAGYTESTGDFYNTNNDFDFWGLSLYGGLSKDNFTLMADVGYSSVFGELSQDTAAGLGFSTLKADTQSDVWTLGLTAAYTFKTDFMDITPHAGVRYMNVTTYGFDTKSNGVVQTHTAESSQDVWYFPVGVTFSKDIVSQSGWIFTPKLDLGFIAAAGDLDARSVTSIPGVAGSAEYTMKNVDGFAFNGGLGFDLAHKENGVSVGVNYNVQASEHETSHMIFANFRYEF